MHAPTVVGVMSVTTWQYSPLYNLFQCWKEMVKLSTQSKDVENVYCHSCHLIPLAAEIEHQGGCIFQACSRSVDTESDFLSKSHPC